MKTLNTIFAAALVSLSLNSFASDCPSLSGKMTIGKSETADFANMSDAVEALKCGGITAPVTFVMESGTYNEKITMGAIQGASAYNTITFQSKTGSNADVVIGYANSDATIVMNGTSYISFENLTIDHKSATYGNAARIDGKSNGVHFKSVIFDGVEVSRTGANSAAVYFASSAPKADISFEDCEINNGSVGIYKSGMNAEAMDSKTTITGTLFFNQYEAGLSLSNEDAPVVSNNVVSSLSTYTSFKAISMDHVANRVVVSNNIVNATTASVGLVMNNCTAQATAMGQISNNSIAVGGSSQAFGILLSGTTENQVLNFNRVKLTISGNQTNTQAYYKNNGSGNNINMMNNIFYDLKTGAYTIIGNSYKDFFNQLPAQSNPALSASANGIMIEKVSQIK